MHRAFTGQDAPVTVKGLELYAEGLNNCKGVSLFSLGRHKEALAAHEKAFRLIRDSRGLEQQRECVVHSGSP